MTANFYLHKTIIFILNIVAISFLLFRIQQINNDKAILLLIFYYPILLLINLVLWLIVRICNKEHANVYKQSVAGLLFLLIPVIIIYAIMKS